MIVSEFVYDNDAVWLRRTPWFRACLKVASAKSEIIGKCKRSINACLHDKPPSKGEWKSLQGARVNQSHLETVRELRDS